MGTCTFCGSRGQMTREHVWAKWLRQYSAFGLLADTYRGERETREEAILRLDSDGRYSAEVIHGPQVATLLPFVTVPVCGNCNHGWMSRLESSAKVILDPLIRGEKTTVTAAQQEILARWVAKSAYAYVVSYSEPNVPFQAGDYRSLAKGEPVPARCVVWLARSFAPTAHIAMSVHPLLVAPSDTDPEKLGTMAATAANVYLAAHSVVFVAHWRPEPLRLVFDDLFRFEDCGFSRIWPPRRELAWPPDPVPNDMLVAVREALVRAIEAASLPLEGRTIAELQSIAQDFRAGTDAAELRRQW